MILNRSGRCHVHDQCRDHLHRAQGRHARRSLRRHRVNRRHRPENPHQHVHRDRRGTTFPYHR